MKLNRQLNLVIPVHAEDGETVRAYVHSVPISSEVYTMHWRVLSRTFSDIITSGLMPVGARVAAKMLEDVSRDLATGDGTQETRSTLLPEIHRLTNVIVSGEKGWSTLPLEDAVKTGALDKSDADEIEGTLVFFTVGSHLFMRANRAELLTGAVGSWGGRIVSSDCTAFLNSLQTSTSAASSGAPST